MAEASRLNDPVMVIATELATLERRLTELDTPGHVEQCSQRFLDEEVDRLNERIQILRDSISAIRARSIEGALCQLSTIDVVLDVMWASVLSEERAERDKDAVRRMLYSIREFLMPMCSTTSPAVELYRSEYLNPWLTVEERAKMEAAYEAEKARPRCSTGLN
jgi:hypothetical protein